MTITHALLRGWWILAACTALGGTAAALVTSTTAPTYRATTSYYVSVAGQDTASAVDIAQGSAAAQQKIKSYTELASAPRVLQTVITDLDLDVTPAELARQVTATVRTGTVIISIAVTESDAAKSAKIAESVGTTLAAVVSQIEPASVDGAPSVKLEEVTPAVTPQTPIGPKTIMNIVLGIGGGAAVGTALALLRAALDTRIRTTTDVADLGIALVGDIAFDAEADRRPLIVRDEANSPRTEAFRSLRTNIQFLRTGGPRSIAVTSARPSEGKTTTTANLAIALSQSGMRTIVIDADLRRPNLAKTMGIEGAVGLTDLLVGRAELDDVLQPWGTDSLTILPAGTIPPNPSELIGSEAMEHVLEELTARFDVVLIDTPPLLAVTDATLISTLVSTTLLVSAANQTKRSELRLAVDALERVGQHADGLVLTKTKHKISGYGYYRSEYTNSPTGTAGTADAP
ncbi:polysaccharide biosynthesis tyrosine autokinase [Curtobacterium pusillum]|uniref:non-specific protein-tyrosine kinase n=2 Tax=Curtobacterium pusillum TaxID=69373 RepID=A0ABX2M8P4_9MICO|nr:polysaccharide biosynthesis tyrosine autokinase [Curtobacterium pusillum]NUU14320.1 polysaccharide biosynthesis tyrosine autokinase [Curtobacterium pusillum]